MTHGWPDDPTGAYRAYLLTAAATSASRSSWTSADGPLPTLYLSHGATQVYSDAAWIQQLADWGKRLPKPLGIVIVSAHWEDAPMRLSNPTAGTPLLYDYGGMPAEFYRLQYATPGAEWVAQAVRSLFSDQVVHEDRRGLDHGAFVPLMMMYPAADVPVIQLSIPTQHPESLIALGRRLGELRQNGILVIGSGHMTHGLPFLTREMMFEGHIPGWSSDFDAWAADALERRAVDELLDFRSRAPGMPYAHPTVDHFIPIFIALGAGDIEKHPAITRVEGYTAGFSKRSFELA
ncbi:dioxygenase family protein [Pseudarthrobacter oxydans]|nr:class III extradiol ring-cleavage dioxygenase [Pseudarthrobacter oxydans]